MTADRFRPMLADDAPENLAELKFPVLASTKLDGVRCIVRGGVAYSRNLKPFVNKLVQKKFGRAEFNGLDGELIDGPPTALDVFSRTQSVTKKDGKSVDELVFHVFDTIRDGPAIAYQDRYETLVARAKLHPELKLVPHLLAGSVETLEEWEQNAVEKGWEGLMVRSLYGPYKYGRSTVKEGWLLKVKRFAHDEALVIGVYEQQENTNAQTLDERGFSKRNSKKAGKVGKGTLGGFRVRMLTGNFKGVELDVGTGNGWTDEKRQGWYDMWHGVPNAEHRSDWWLAGFGHMRVKHQLVGSKDAPRFPIGDGWREPGQ